MSTILSIQSHVAFGYVGNRAAVFPLQRLGHEVIAINTVQFSNHTGHGDWTGEVFTAKHVQDILDGIERRGVLENVDALLTGYLGDAAIGDIILKTLECLPSKAVWLCDPVMGDVDGSFYVREDIPDFFKSRALPRAKMITPNQFELEFLTATKIQTLDHARAACVKAHNMGPDIVLLTSLLHDGTDENKISMLASSKSGEQYLVTTPRLPITPAPNGSGDCTAALFLSNYLEGYSLEESLARTAGSIYKVFEETQKRGTRELALIQAQEYFVHPASMPTSRL